ncbi:MAG: DUF1269 domain-containing protein [Cyanobacteria bacterium SZAS LIN-2]|nr:DUF1269 domain-containing protein [Cyanobacteria bacterium SZAS LIN-3]MBS1996605.1 DUF1269 domain-containing protein [Cyanobacteria bacterium SZAS LIN-2]MBS2007056.1 DUF1269 domain-containing protein [Cyanobacteria bacterium SZAS TMP-1]
MSTLVVIAYDDMNKAQQMRHELVELEKEYLVDLEDAVVVTRDAKGKVKLHQVVSLPALGAMQGGFWGTLIGCLFFSPIFGMTLGAATGAISGALTDVGINDDFMKELGTHLQPNTSALCVLIRQMTNDKVMEHLVGTGGKVLKSNLSKEDETKLQEALNAAQKEHAAAATTVGAQA